MEPLYTPNAFEASAETLTAVPWVDRVEARRECFMSLVPREYAALDGDPNVCFLNRYEHERNALGWHSDDSPDTSDAHPISVVSFGEPREIWWRPRGARGVVPESNRFLLEPGSLFVMPPGFQRAYEHRIPKGSHSMGSRTSLTFRHMLPMSG